MSNIAPHKYAGASLLKRLWAYQAERFPIFKTALLVGFFTAASLCVSSNLAMRPLPGMATFIVIWLTVLIVFFQMRACDEYKDLESDTKFRPERAIPSGLVSLKLIVSLAVIMTLVAVLLTVTISTHLLLPLLAVWTWLTLMTFEFFVPKFLHKHAGLYLISHMAIMPLIDLYATAGDWLVRDTAAPAGLWYFLALSFFNGCVLEIGRKIWAPENEREGVETYSGLLGYKKAAILWVGICFISLFLLLGLSRWLNVTIPILIGSGSLFVYIAWRAAVFIKAPSDKGEKSLDNLAGIWVLASYAFIGFMPFIFGGYAWIA